MPDNASRRGAVDMGMPLMILAFLVIGGFMWWLKGQSDAELAARVVEEVVEEEAPMPEGGVELGELTAVGTDPSAFEGETIRGVGYEVASAFGTAGFWVTTANGNPFLVAYSGELRARGATVREGDVRELLAMEISYLDEWLAEGTINENDKIIGEFATHFVAASDVTVTGSAGGADAGDGAGD